MKEIPLTRGRVTLVDDEDYEPLVSLGRWQVIINPSGTEYARMTLGSRRNRRDLLMHRVILLAPQGIEVDHRDRNGLNNRRLNLRLATPSQNQGNRVRSRSASSRFKGVFRTQSGYKAAIRKDGEQRYLGHFPTDIEAAHAYDAAALRLFGEFARINFPNGVPADMQPWGAIRG